METKIYELQKENQELKLRMENIENSLVGYRNAIYELAEQIKEIGNMLSNSHEINIQEHALMKSIITNLSFEVGATNEESDFFYPTIINSEQTIEKIIKERKSIARFGDGEFAIMFAHYRQPFQRQDDTLQKRLIEVVRSDNSNLLIGIANNYGNLEKYTDFAADGIRIYMQPETRREHMQILSPDKTYYDAYMSRPYVMLRDKYTDAPAKRFAHLRQIWDGRNVIMIEGAQTRMGVGNDLFDNCKSIRRIIGPATNTFDRYDTILKSALKNAQEEDLFLIATGPCAGVFAYDLTMYGYQAVDLGHLDVEYDWFKKGTGEREPLANKYTNEIPGDEQAEEICDPWYEDQIIAKFI